MGPINAATPINAVFFFFLRGGGGGVFNLFYTYGYLIPVIATNITIHRTFAIILDFSSELKNFKKIKNTEN